MAASMKARHFYFFPGNVSSLVRFLDGKEQTEPAVFVRYMLNQGKDLGNPRLLLA